MTRPRLSVVVVTLNEEERLRACLESAAWADELIVVDALSPDKTAQIAREFTDRVILRPWPGFAAQKNFAIGEASGDWILSLDADEMVSPELRGEIARGGLWPDWQLRLFRRGRGRFVERAVHESVEVAGSVGRLEGPLIHRSYRDVADFLARADRYSTLAAEQWRRSGRPARTSDMVLRPLGRFFSMYVLQLGVLDGTRGFLLASLYAYYVLIRSVKAWERQKASNRG